MSIHVNQKRITEKVRKTASVSMVSKTLTRISNKMHVIYACTRGLKNSKSQWKTVGKAAKKLKSVDVQKCHKTL
jgi:hypothetical protein